jgi:hypothetical protein
MGSTQVSHDFSTASSSGYASELWISRAKKKHPYVSWGRQRGQHAGRILYFFVLAASGIKTCAFSDQVLESFIMCTVGQNYTFMGIYSVHSVFLAGKPAYIRAYTVQIYGSGQP